MLFATAICGFLFYKLANPFVAVWVGEDLVLPLTIIFAISINIMFKIIKSPIDQFKEAYGIFWDIYAPIIESIINLVFSILLAIKFGLIGIVIGTIVSNICIIFIWKPYVIFKHVFKERLIKFFMITAKYMGIALIGVAISCIFMGFIPINIANKYVNLVVLFIVYGLIAITTLLACFVCDKFFRNTLRKYFNIVLNMIKRKEA